ncbi:MAG: O-antigen ligase family protein, partial [Candidatus Portnoybacteria bacterium]|nr:O-antigen ligase family protein [Candidatus Portnoybacteria bacterium]
QLGQEAVSEVSLFERARSIIDFLETSIKGRLEIWQRTIDSIIIRPLLGVGLGNYPLVLNEPMSASKRGASAHSLYLEIAAEMGVFALIILLIIFWQIFKDAWRIFTQHKGLFFRVWAGFFLLALIWILGYSLFDIVIFNDKVLLFFIANLGLLYAAKSSFPAPE